MSPETRTCAKCGRDGLPGDATFCAFCGAAIPTARQQTRLPDRASLNGPCAVIFAGQEELDVRRVGRLVAETVKRPLADVTRELRTSKGFIAKDLDAADAIALSEKAERELESPLLVVPQAEIVELPAVMRMRRAAITAGGIECEAYTWTETQKISVAWNEVFLVSCGRLEIAEAVQEQGEKKSSLIPQLPPITMQSKHEYLLDVMLKNPWRRLRLDQNTAAFSLTEMQRLDSDLMTPLFKSAANLARFAQGAPMNFGVQLLARKAWGDEWVRFTFGSKRDFDAYTHWLLQLVKFGVALPV